MQFKLSKLIHIGMFVVVTALSGCGGNSVEDPKLQTGHPMAGAPADIPTFLGPRSNYFIVKNSNNFSVLDVVGNEGERIIPIVERIQFADVSILLDMADKVSTISKDDYQRIVELYIAFFNRLPDADGLSYWIGRVKAGMTIEQISNSFYDAAIQYTSLTGYTANMPNVDFVKIIYKNVLGRTEVDQEGLNYWSNEIGSGRKTRGFLIKTILDSAHTFKGDPTYGKVADFLDNKFIVANNFANLGGVNFNTSTEAISKGMEIMALVTPVDISAAMKLVDERSSNTKSAVSANAGANQDVEVGKSVTLVGQGSSRVPGPSLSFSWKILKKPTASEATLNMANMPTTSFVADAEGVYEIELTTSNGTYYSMPSSVKISAKVKTLISTNAGANQEAEVGKPVTLNGEVSTNLPQLSLSFSWKILKKPVGSKTTLSSANMLTTTFVPDAEGEYELELSANNGTYFSLPSLVKVTAKLKAIPSIERKLGEFYAARNGLSVKINSFTVQDQGNGYNIYTVNYTQLNTTAFAIDEGQIKLYFSNDKAMPQYGGFNRVYPGEIGAVTRTYEFQQLKTSIPSILEFDHDNFFSTTPVANSLQWRLPIAPGSAGAITLSSSDFFGQRQLSFPYTSNTNFSSSIIGANSTDIGTYTLTATGKDFTISGLEAKENGGIVVPFFGGLTNGQVIKAGTSITFSLGLPLTRGKMVNLLYKFSILETGQSFVVYATGYTN